MCCVNSLKSKLVCLILAKVFFGSLTPGSRSSVSVGTQLTNSILRTRPTNTSRTRTRLLALSANSSAVACTYSVV